MDYMFLITPCFIITITSINPLVVSFLLLYGQSPWGTMENRLVPVPGSRCIVSQILGIPWVAKTLYVLMDSFWLEARQLQHGSWSAEDQDGTRELELSYPLTSGKGRTAMLDHVWLCYCSPPGSSIHEISQARILEQVAAFYCRRSSQLRDQTCVPCIGRWILYHWCHPGSPWEGETGW